MPSRANNDDPCYDYINWYDRQYNREFDNSCIREYIDNNNFLNVRRGITECVDKFLQNPSFLNTDWRFYAHWDRILHETTPISLLPNNQAKLLYLLFRYTIPYPILKRLKKSYNMTFYYTSERNIQIVISLLKAHGIRRVITSPGATNVAINISLQHDSYFTLYSSIDERSAAYMACGMAAESGEAVALTCTGATSSRNYFPGLTEAYYRHLPILAITCSRSNAYVGHGVDQVTDRSTPPKDTVKLSVHAQQVHCSEDEWDVMTKVNRAILEMFRNGGGPCHINLVSYASNFNVKDLPATRVIKRYFHDSQLPQLPEGKIAIFVGAHNKWSDKLTKAVDLFCEQHNAVVLYDGPSNYKGKYGIPISLLCEQLDYLISDNEFSLMIHIGNITSTSYNKASKYGEFLKMEN